MKYMFHAITTNQITLKAILMRKALLTLLLTVQAVWICAANIASYEQMKAQLNDKSLPLVNITVDISIVSKPNYTNATIEIADPQARTDGNVVTTFNCKVKYRGATSLWYDKKSFAVKLLDADGNSLDAPVLGIREDDSWILGAMAIDRVRMRDRLNFDIWNDFSKTPYDTDYNGRNGTKGYFVELFINGKYHGLYCLTDKVNRKLLGVKKAKTDDYGNPTINGVMYKCAEWGDASYLKGYYQQSMNGESWNNWELDYPDDYPCETAYTPLKNFIDYCTKTSDADFEAGLDENVYMQNMVDYHVFYLAMGLRDNTMKNAFMSITNINKGKRLMITPWDLDTSMGGEWEGSYYNKVADNDMILEVRPFARLWNDNIGNYRTAVADRWRVLHRTLLSEEAFNARVDAYMNAFIESGAWEREYSTWNGSPVALKKDLREEADYIKTWYKENCENLENNIFKDIPTEIVDETEYEKMVKTMDDKSLPLINLTMDATSVNNDKYTSAAMEIADPLARTSGNVSDTLNCKVKYRGESALKYDKKSLNVKLLDANGKSLDAPLLGIRPDDAWILDAMASDASRLRNRLCFDVWNDMQKTPYDTDYEGRNGTKGFFVELFVNGKYHGLYCLSDKVNRKLLALKKAKEADDGTVTVNGVMYKGDKQGTSTLLAGYDNEPMDGTTWNDWELEYPDDYPCKDAWMPLQGFIDFCTSTTNDEFEAGIGEHAYVQNLTDYHVLALAFGLNDNTMKNTFLSTPNINKGTRMLITPWGLDASLGNDGDGNMAPEPADNATVLKVKPYERLWNEKMGDYPYNTAKRWRELREGVLANEAFNARVDAYADALTTSGAWQREYDAWGDNAVKLQEDLSKETEYIKAWYAYNSKNLQNEVLGGIESGIQDITAQPDTNGCHTLYNIQGQKVNAAYKGVVISNGKKFVVK